MSKDIVIQKNGVPETWQGVDTIRTNTFGGGEEEWVPEDEYAGRELTVAENGTYTAESYGAYAFTRVIVMVRGKVVRGYIDGILYDITIDANGYLVFTPVAE